MNQGSGLAGKEPRSREISPTPHAAPWPGDTSSLNPVQGHIFLAPPPGLQQGRTCLLLKLHSDKKFWLHPASGKITLNSNNWVLLGKTTSKQLSYSLGLQLASRIVHSAPICACLLGSSPSTKIPAATRGKGQGKDSLHSKHLAPKGGLPNCSQHTFHLRGRGQPTTSPTFWCSRMALKPGDFMWWPQQPSQSLLSAGKPEKSVTEHPAAHNTLSTQQHPISLGC